MKVVAVIAQVLLLLLGSTARCAAATTDNGAAFEAVLVYPPGPRSSEMSRVVRYRGKTYRFRLKPEREMGRRPFGFQLVMEQANPHSVRAPNVLDPTGRIHGYQKWDFLAIEFAPGHAVASFSWGAKRTVHVPKLGIDVQIEVVHSDVRPRPANSPKPSDYEFAALALMVVVRARG